MQAYAADPFNTETVNTLRLLDDIDDMRVSYADVLADPEASNQDQEQEPIGRMLLRLNRDSVDALEPAANHLLPRWFSEGISVYEEWNTGPLPSRELPIQVLSRFSEGAFLPVDRLDAGFVRPTYEGQVNVSYMQAGLICDFIAERWGHQALVTMLKAFANGDSTKTALQKAIDLESSKFDALFNAHVSERYANILTNQQHWQQLGQIIQSSLARMARARWQWYVRGGSVPAEMQRLATDLEAAGREEDAFAVLESLNWVMPYTVATHRRLGDYYLANGEPVKAIREFNALLGIRPEAESVVLLGKAKAYRQQGNEAQARRNVLLALERTPFFRDAQKLLLELNELNPGE